MANKVTIKSLNGNYKFAPFYAVPHQDPKTRGYKLGEQNLPGKWKNSVHKVTKDDQVIITHGMMLNKDLEEDFCKYAFLLEVEEVANRLADFRPDKHLFFIEDIEAEAELSVAKDDLMLQAFEIIGQNRSIEKMRNIIYFLSRDPEGMTENVMKQTIYSKAKTDPQAIIDSVESDGKHKIFLAKLFHKQIITKRGDMYMYGERVIGKDENDAILFLMNPKNENLVTMLGDKLNFVEGKEPGSGDPTTAEIILPDGKVIQADEAKCDELLKEYSLTAPPMYKLNGKSKLLNKHFDDIRG